MAKRGQAPGPLRLPYSQAQSNKMACIFTPRCPSPTFHLWARSAKLSTKILRAEPRMESSSAAVRTPADSIEDSETSAADTVVQYVVLRRDLIDTWPLGSVVTQGCHASVAAIWSNKDDAHTLLYCSPSKLDSMHKVTLEVKGESQLLNLSEKLNTAGIAHKLWIEHPENFATCLATKPYPKSSVSSYFKKLKLCGAVEFTLGLEIKRHKAESPIAFHVHGLNHAAAVWTSSRRRLPSDYSLILVANKHQTHLLRFISRKQ